MSKVTREELLEVLEPIAALYHWWVADDTGTGHSLVGYYASGKPREERLASITLTRQQVLEIVDLVKRAREEES